MDSFDAKRQSGHQEGIERVQEFGNGSSRRKSTSDEVIFEKMDCADKNLVNSSKKKKLGFKFRA